LAGFFKTTYKTRRNIVAVQKLIKSPHPVLRQKCPVITSITDDIRQTAADLLDTLRAHKAHGIAAPQIGQSLRMLAINTAKIKGLASTEIVAINPVLQPGTSLRIAEEGCLSLPGVLKSIKRFTYVTVEYTDLQGERQHIFASEMFARVWQHEYDHLEGILIIDK